MSKDLQKCPVCGYEELVPAGEIRFCGCTPRSDEGFQHPVRLEVRPWEETLAALFKRVDEAEEALQRFRKLEHDLKLE